MSVPEKQGHIGDIQKKTLPELYELLDRQEKLLKKQKFLQTLPDKGTKVKNFADTLRTLIAERENLVKPNLQEVKLLKHGLHRQVQGQVSAFKSAHDNGQSFRTRSSDTLQRDVVQLGGNSNQTDVNDTLSACLERVTLSSDQVEVRGDNRFINSYERVIKTANENPARSRVFKPNSSLKISKVQDLPDAYKCRSIQSKQVGDPENKSKVESPCDHNSQDSRGAEKEIEIPVSQVEEESAVCIPKYKYDKSVLISVEESVKLVEEQRKNHEDLQTRQAAERLANRLHIRLDDYNPEGTNMNYRVPTPDSDSDDEPEVEGYED